MSRIDQALRRLKGAESEAHPEDPFKLGDFAAEPSSEGERPADARPPAPTAVPELPAAARVAEPAVAAKPAPQVSLPPVAPQPPSHPVPSRPASTAVRRSSSGINPPATLVRQCERLAAILHDRQVNDGLKTVSVMSAQVNEGRTLTVATLAAALTRTYGSRVLLIDRDLRHPTLHECLGVADAIGPSALSHHPDGDPQPVVISPCLHLLAAGPGASEPNEERVSERLRDLLETYAPHFDWILVDTPAMSLLDEPAALARLTRAVVFVVGPATPFPTIQREIAKLGRPTVVGTVLRGIDERPLN